ncbi:enoyl-CoA hydratase-related protein [Natronoglycomyces albus]|uniref:Enoyl-CoA hydratase/isomerase family protein n=1 Tax=Natronoglycomyces albus TaxID=2811108 RepID=A0A895XGK4_9ACTN|nr:enoyl-CoA hydratase-related protein [Natronoglycomyces albus]QSB04474.1 enoyl-CoA hydratase/isomerase family protein [Natronoglycomyces albus]
MAGATSETFVKYEAADGVATITLDSPTHRNALSNELLAQLEAALHRASGDEEVRVVVLTHTGRVFCAGVDLAATAQCQAAGELPAAALPQVLAAIWECPKTVIASISGPVRGGGLGLVAAADISVCAAEATLAFTEVRLGVVPAVIAPVVLRKIRATDARELFLTGSTFDGRRAEATGLVTRSVPAADVEATVNGFVTDLLQGAPGAQAGVKRLLSAHEDVRGELEAAAKTSTEFFLGEEGRHGVQSFLAKKSPDWVVPE